MVSRNDTNWLELLDVKGSKYNANKAYARLLDSAYRLALPLEFCVVGKEISCIRKLNIEEECNYLKAFTPIQFYKLENLIQNDHDNQCFEICERYQFYKYLKGHFHSLRLTDFKIGCEARAGIIAKYLEEKSDLQHYKIFINGELKFKTHNASYVWAHHVLNLLSINRNNRVVYYVFDPFILGGLSELNTVLKQFEKSGSMHINYRITDANVFICLMQKPIGIIDEESRYSKTIFQQLYIP